MVVLFNYCLFLHYPARTSICAILIFQSGAQLLAHVFATDNSFCVKNLSVITAKLILLVNDKKSIN